MQQIVDPYRALGVARSATDVEIKAAHRKLVKRYHPDTGSKSDTERFLRVQDAYRVLSDPLARKEWDLKHAPGPVRADRSAGTTTRRRRPPTSTPKPESEPAETPPPPRERSESADPRTQPRSSRAYTWSASEVPWWEEAGTRSDKRPPRRPQATPRPEPVAPKQPDEPVFTQPDMDVYNRSSGAAWSMAARAYFRKGDADLPKRGSFHHEGTQVVTAGRARSAAQADARRRAAAQSAQAAGHAADDDTAHARAAAQAEAVERAEAEASTAQASATAPAAAAQSGTYSAPPRPAAPPTQPQPSARPRPSSPGQPQQQTAYAYSTTGHAPSPAAGTTRIVRRALPAAWPSVGNRFAYALIAWLPMVVLSSLLLVDSVDFALSTALVAVMLIGLLALPRVAYVAAVATVLALVVGGLFIGGLLLAGRLPSLDNVGLFVSGLLGVAYLATAAVIAIGPRTLRPWSGS